MPAELAEPDRLSRRRAEERILAPVASQLRRASVLAIVAELTWPAQAAVIAWAVAAWVSGTPPLWPALIGGLALVFGGAARAWLEHRAGALLQSAADKTIARERREILLREGRAASSLGSARIAALTVQKIAMLEPWITRYTLARWRTALVPPVLLLLSFALSWIAGGVLLVAGPLIPMFMALVGLAAERTSREQMEEIGTLNDLTMERLSAMLDIRLLGAVDRVATAFAKKADALRERTMAVLRVAFLSSTVLELFSALGVAMIAVFVGFTLLGEITVGSWGTPLTVGEGVFLLLIAPDFFKPMRDLAAAWHDRAAGLAVVEEMIALEESTRMPVVGEAASAAPLAGPLSVTFTNARVARDGGVLRLPDFSLAAGEMLALTGSSGAGKTTMLAALAGLVPLASGDIFVNGRRLANDTADAWRQRLAYLPQRPHFADRSLAEWLDARGIGADPHTALARADAADIVARLPKGLATRLGESGGGVSGGEARRLMLARAIMMGGDLLLADEPTADLDAQTSARVTAALHALNEGGMAVLVATHDEVLARSIGRHVSLAP